MNLTKMLTEFHAAAGDEIPQQPQFPSTKTVNFRKRLIKEECVIELNQAIRNRDIVKVADAIADGIYVLVGTALAFGLDIDPILEIVHKSNMAKFPNGKGRRRKSDGKVLKPAGWTPPDIASEIYRQVKKGDCV